MYIIAIAWLYVALLMAASERSITAGVLTFLFYGLLPCALLLWLLGTGHRKRAKNARLNPEDSPPLNETLARTDTENENAESSHAEQREIH